MVEGILAVVVDVRGRCGCGLNAFDNDDEEEDSAARAKTCEGMGGVASELES